MVTQCRRIQNLGLVVIDSFQMIQSAGSSAIWSCENADHAGISISRTLKIMARELNVPVVCTSELSRAIEFREDKRPMLSDLHDTGVIEQYIDVVIGLYRGSYYSKEHENPNSAEAIILKNPKGSTGTVPLFSAILFPRLSLAAKLRLYRHTHNRLFVAFRIPTTWYAIYHPCGIVTTVKAP